ncbi:hypothetical protein J6S88_03220 [bacterium]|nr:hypothetical protein [bacterium]
MNTQKNVKIGFWGCPERTLVNELKSKYPNADWLDLDLDLNAPDKHILPESYCKIIKNIINNSLGMKDKLDIIVAPIGKDKCDSGWFAAQLLKDMGFEVIECINPNIDKKRPLVISTSNLPLYDKFNIIMNNIIDEKALNAAQCKPKFGFWGVPPNDMEILKLFPDETHVYGWTRCVERGTPADVAEEMYVEPDVPTVFYAQSFCAKCQLAKYLADKYNGLYIDIDDYATNSVRAKIEAFLRLS